MNHCAIQKSAFRNRDGMKNLEQETMICPKPRRFGVFSSSFSELPVRSLRRNPSYKVEEVCESNAESDILEIILAKAGGGSDWDQTSQLSSSPPFFSGSPPSRVSNPLVQDSIFRNADFIFTQISPPPPPLSSSSSARKGGCVRESFRSSPAVRIEGFDCLDRERRRNRSIPALA